MLMREYAAIVIDVEQVDDHRQPAFKVAGGVNRDRRDESERDAFERRLRALNELAAR
jgi:hypothetical protein